MDTISDDTEGMGWVRVQRLGSDDTKVCELKQTADGCLPAHSPQALNAEACLSVYGLGFRARVKVG